MFSEWIPKSRDSEQLKKHRVSVSVLTLGTDNMWKPDERSSVGLGAKESMEEFDKQWYRVWKWCEIEQGASGEISEMGQNGKTEDTVWQP